jgi:hypothetical protein
MRTNAAGGALRVAVPIIVLLAGCTVGGSQGPVASPGSPVTATQAPASASPSPTPNRSLLPTAKAATFGPFTVVSGQVTCNGGSDGTQTTDTRDVTHIRGGTLECAETTNDARVSGRSVWGVNMDRWGTGPRNAAMVQWGSVRITNDGGSWEGTYTGTYDPDRGDTIVAWMKGSGGYAGLVYFELVTGHGPWDSRGQVSADEPLPPAR